MISDVISPAGPYLLQSLLPAGLALKTVKRGIQKYPCQMLELPKLASFGSMEQCFCHNLGNGGASQALQTVPLHLVHTHNASVV